MKFHPAGGPCCCSGWASWPASFRGLQNLSRPLLLRSGPLGAAPAPWLPVAQAWPQHGEHDGPEWC